MITKERLLAGLHEIIYIEEGMVGMFASFTKALTKVAEDLDEDQKKEIEKLLSRLHRDSARHKKTIEEMAVEIEGGKINEY